VASVIVLDANVMIAILDSSDAHFAAAKALFLDHATERLVAHRVTLAETLVQPARAAREQAAAAALDALGVARLDEPDDPVGLARLRAESGLRMPDSLVLHAAIRESAKLATFDARLAEVAHRWRVPVVTADRPTRQA
jgi:predicted nucleic acid-binding protein